jgi:hypothetical protein
VKNHLANIEKTKSVKMRDHVSHEVQEEMQKLLYVCSQKKKERESLCESMRADLHKSLGDSDEEIDEGRG